MKMKQRIKKMVLAPGIFAALMLGLAAASCGTIKNITSPVHAIDKNGQLFPAISSALGIDLVNRAKKDGKGIFAQTFTIDGVKYPYAGYRFRSSLIDAEAIAVRDSIYPGAPDGWDSYYPGMFLIYVYKPDSYTPPPPPPVQAASVQVQPSENPTLTREELEKVELAYAETVWDIEQWGRRLKINNMSERAAFIQRWQGRPDTTQAETVRKEEFPYYYSIETPETAIVAMSKKEPNTFRKVRMIHDWVADIFAYDHDYLWWMENVSRQNKLYTLGEIIKLKRGVCFEYAILFYFLMDSAGIETYLISDYSKPGIGHAYNMVVIDGTGYIIDTTWDSGNKYGNGKYIWWYMTYKKDYFMPSVSQSYTLRRW